MKIICHRGCWKSKKEQNSLSSIQKSFAYDGVEIDLRSLNGRIVLSHDPLSSGVKYPLLEDAFRLGASKKFFWALNIKEDGLSEMLSVLLKKYKIANYMCFDLSFPEAVCYERKKIKTFSRTGDREPEIHKRNLVFDCFSSISFSRSIRRVPATSTVMVISPELHGNAYHSAWKVLRKMSFKSSYLCTDFPEEAIQFFQELKK